MTTASIAQALCDDATVTNETELNAAIDDYNGNCSGGDVLAVTLATTIALSASTNSIDDLFDNGGELIFTGNGTLDGSGSSQLFDIIDGDVTIDDLTLLNGDAISGGAVNVDIDGVLTVTGSVFQNNSASNGRAIDNHGDATFVDSRFESNDASQGGGAISSNGTLTVTGSTFVGNSAFSQGGAIRTSNTLAVTNSTFDNNDAGEGGAISNSLLELDIANSTFHGNSAATSSGGGIYNNGGTITIGNSIVANNSGDDCVNDGGTWNSPEANLDSDGSCSDFTITDDPLLQPLADNGGPTPTLALQPGSPAIDAATACPSPASDQRGVDRPQDPACNLGAFELKNLALAIDGAGTGKGSVETTGIACNIDAGATSGDCQATFAENQTVMLTAQPEPFSEFAGWSGDCSGTDAETSVTLDTDTTCTAEFTLAESLIFKDRFETDS